MAERQQYAQIVRPGERLTIEFHNAAWKHSTLAIVVSPEGIVSVESTQDDITITGQVMNLRRNQ